MYAREFHYAHTYKYVHVCECKCMYESVCVYVLWASPIQRPVSPNGGSWRERYGHQNSIGFLEYHNFTDFSLIILLTVGDGGTPQRKFRHSSPQATPKPLSISKNYTLPPSFSLWTQYSSPFGFAPFLLLDGCDHVIIATWPTNVSKLIISTNKQINQSNNAWLIESCLLTNVLLGGYCHL